MDQQFQNDTVGQEPTPGRRTVEEPAGRYHAYFVSSPVAIMVLDSAGRFIEVNPAASRMTGYERSALLAMSLADLVAVESLDAGLEHFARVKELGHANGECTLACRDGSRRWITCDAVRLSENRLIAFALDVTDRKKIHEALRQSQASFRSMFFDSSLGVELYDADGRLLQANQACLDIFGVEDEADVLNFNLFEDPNVSEQMKSEIRHGRTVRYEVPFDFELVKARRLYKTRKSGKIHLSVVISPITIGPGKSIRQYLVQVEDTTERKRAEEALKASEENLRTFFNSSDELLFVLSLEGRIVHVNDTVTAKLHYSPEDLVGKSILCVHPEDRRAEAARIVADMAAGRAAMCPIPVVTREGRRIPVETRVVSGRWSGQDVLFGISKDLSELRASEERFSKAFHSNPSPMAISSLADHRFLDVNEAFLHTLGYRRDEVLGATAEELRVFADPRQRLAALTALGETGTVRRLEADVRTKDGEIRHGLFSAEIIQLQDQRVLLTVMNDITHRKRMERMLRESEERYRLLVEAIPQLVWRSGPNGRETDGNRRWYEYTGQTPAEVRAQGWLSVVHPDDLAGATQRALHAASTQEPFEFECRLRRGSDGGYRWHLCRVSPLEDKDGRVANWFGCATDIEDLKRAQEVLRKAHEEQLERHRAELAQVARLSMMGEMAAGLAHELNQPLHAINNYASGSLLRVMRSPQKDQELVAALERISEEASRAAEIIRRVKGFVQKREPQVSRVCLNKLVDEVVALNKLELLRRQASVALDLSDDLPRVTGDLVQIEQVIMNLVRNALEAMEETPVENRIVGVKTARCGDDRVQLEVRDCGKGIPEEHREKIFEPFFTTKSEGMGMGLAISRSIVQTHGGHLRLSANQDQGCTFRVTLPIDKRS